MLFYKTRKMATVAPAEAVKEVRKSNWCCEKSNDNDAVEPETTKKELHGWYLYDFTNAAFLIGTQDFISIFTVEQAKNYAKDHFCQGNQTCIEEAYWAKDMETLGECTGILTDVKNKTECEALDAKWMPEWIDDADIVPLFGMNVHFTATYTTALVFTMIFQILLFIFVGPVTDFGNLRKKMFIVTNVVASVSIIMIYFGKEDHMYEYNLVLVIIAQGLLNFALVMYNAWLPLLAQCTPEAKQVLERTGGGSRKHELEERFNVINTITQNISSTGQGLSLVGGVSFLLFGMIIMMVFGESHGELNVIRTQCLVCGIYILVLSSIATYRLQSRPGPPFPKGKNVIVHSVANLCRTVSKRRQLEQLFKFLLAYWFYSDGLSSLTVAAAIFGTQELGLKNVDVFLAWSLFCILGAIGAVTMSKLSRKYNLVTKQIILVNIAIIGLIPLYAVIALKTRGEFFAVVAVFAFNYGSCMAFTRAIFSSLLPLGQEAEFFSLYQISDKGTSMLGPLTLSLVSTQTGSFRKGFAALSIFYVLGIFFLMRFDHKEAIEEKDRYEQQSDKAKRRSTLRLSSFRS